MISPVKIFSTLFKQTHNSFEGEEEGEKVILLLRRHPFIILIRLAFSFFLCLVPVFIAIFFTKFLIVQDLLPLFLFLSALWYTLLWQIVFYALTMYTLDVWIVTNRRIIDSTQNGFFNRTVSELKLSRIQDVSVNTRGVIPTLLKYGNLQIQTAGAQEKFLFMQIPNPEKVKGEIMRVASAEVKQV
jgi:uncharacterized membrane protein YdbT with pleckstrin-like domain